jgi:hypothetical protein
MSSPLIATVGRMEGTLTAGNAPFCLGSAAKIELESGYARASDGVLKKHLDQFGQTMQVRKLVQGVAKRVL